MYFSCLPCAITVSYTHLDVYKRQEFIGGDRVALVLGDNIFYGQSFSQVLKRAAEREHGATIFGYYVKRCV